MHPKKDKHFSFHIGVHMFAVLTIFVIALLVGYSAKELNMNSRGFLAAALVGTDTTAVISEAMFTVSPSQTMRCDSGITRTSVSFSSNPLSAGVFNLSRDGGSGISILPGDHALANGSYHWSAVVNPKYVGSGVLSGDFVLDNHVCPLVSTTDTTAPAPIEQTVSVGPMLDTATLPSVWSSGSEIPSGTVLSKSPVLRVKVSNALHVKFQLTNPDLSSKSFTEQEGVFRTLGTDIWSIDLTSFNIPDGVYEVIALYETSGGKYYTNGVSFELKRTQVASGTVTTQVTSTTDAVSNLAPIPRPTLKVFVENTPVTDRGHAFSDGEVELRVVTPSAKRITLFAASSTAIELGKAVKDDLLSTEKADVWSFVWDVTGIGAGTYNVFARVLYLDNHQVETDPIVMLLVQPPAKQAVNANEGDQEEGMAPTTTNTETREGILSRVTAPALCVNREECQVYCASHPEEGERCALFARTILERSSRTLLSLADDIDPERIQVVLDNQKRSKEIPEEVATPEKLKDFCSELSNADACTKVLIRNDLASVTTLNEKRQAIAVVKEEERRIFVERIGARIFVDTDMDGVADYDEVNIYHTDPHDQDTDKDGFPDGAEIMARTNPLGGKSMNAAGTSTVVLHDESVKLESPRISGTVSRELLAVEDVSIASTASSESEIASSSKLSFRGRATPNSFVTLFIFSEPIVVTIKTDESGAWTYTLDKTLSDGSHEIYSAITDSGGHILAKSEPLPFVKEASAVSIGSSALLPGNNEPGFFSGASLYAFIAIIIGILGIAFSIIGFMVRRRDTENLPLDRIV